LTVEGGVKKMKIARIICWQLDSTLRPTLKRGFDIIPACDGIDMIGFYIELRQYFAGRVY
jgi:hypothetical protein